MAKNFSSFSKALLKAKTEEEVKHAYAEHFRLDYDTEFRHDLYSPEVFFEFKFSRSLQKRDARAAVIAQMLYYVRRLRLGYADKIVPPVICIADGRQAFFTETKKWQKFYSNEKKYDWDEDRVPTKDEMLHDLILIIRGSVLGKADMEEWPREGLRSEFDGVDWPYG